LLSTYSILTQIWSSGFLWDKRTTVSTCPLCGNISTGCTSTVRKSPSSSTRRSRASVDGLQLTYTTRFGRIAMIASSSERSQPLRGGSTTMTSARIPASRQRGSSSSALPTANSALVMPFSSALRSASSIASGTISTPYTFFARCARNNEIVPIPQYASITVSSPVKAAYSNALPYSTSVCTGLTW